MSDTAEKKARKEVRRAQADVERAEGQLAQARKARRKSFQRAHKVGLSLRDINDETGMHWTRVREIIAEK
jgi:hypothetical protein